MTKEKASEVQVCSVCHTPRNVETDAPFLLGETVHGHQLYCSTDCEMAFWQNPLNAGLLPLHPHPRLREIESLQAQLDDSSLSDTVRLQAYRGLLKYRRRYVEGFRHECDECHKRSEGAVGYADELRLPLAEVGMGDVCSIDCARQRLERREPIDAKGWWLRHPPMRCAHCDLPRRPDQAGAGRGAVSIGKLGFCTPEHAIAFITGDGAVIWPRLRECDRRSRRCVICKTRSHEFAVVLGPEGSSFAMDIDDVAAQAFDSLKCLSTALEHERQRFVEFHFERWYGHAEPSTTHIVTHGAPYSVFNAFKARGSADFEFERIRLACS